MKVEEDEEKKPGTESYAILSDCKGYPDPPPSSGQLLRKKGSEGGRKEPDRLNLNCQLGITSGFFCLGLRTHKVFLVCATLIYIKALPSLVILGVVEGE